MFFVTNWTYLIKTFYIIRVTLIYRKVTSITINRFLKKNCLLTYNHSNMYVQNFFWILNTHTYVNKGMDLAF